MSKLFIARIICHTLRHVALILFKLNWIQYICRLNYQIICVNSRRVIICKNLIYFIWLYSIPLISAEFSRSSLTVYFCSPNVYLIPSDFERQHFTSHWIFVCSHYSIKLYKSEVFCCIVQYYHSSNYNLVIIV